MMKKGAAGLLNTVAIVLIGSVTFYLGTTIQSNKDAAIMRQQRVGIFAEPEHCYLCSVIEYDAPCVINLSTGQKSTLRVFEPKDGDYAVPDLDTDQSITRMGNWGNDDVTYVANNGTCEAKIVKSTKDMNEGYFCNACRESIRAVATEGYILADNLNPNQIVLYQLTTSTFPLRHYNITMTECDDSYNVIVTSELYVPE